MGDLTLEPSFEAAVEASSVRVEIWLADELSSPSIKAQRHVPEACFAETLAGLPEEQRPSVILPYWDDWTVAAKPKPWGALPPPLAGLLKWGLQRQRRIWGDGDES
jgi:hypothetical protein